MNENEEVKIDPTLPVEMIRFYQLTGCQETYYPYHSKPLKERFSYKKGQLDGVQNIYYDNGQLCERCTFKDGKAEGLYEEWHKNGKLSKRCTFINGKAEGLFEGWYDDGIIYFRFSYKDGKREGLYEEWNTNGELKHRSVYKNGKLDGLVETISFNSIKRVIYDNNKKVSEEKIPSFTPRDEFLKMNNLNPDGTRKQETKQTISTKKRGGRKL